ncbi:MAG: hypothetical protein K2P58_03025 [Hyphomonadaceae bacterium]|nr:hypothetical protein [Hyphomonadaceae bacterium]
MVATVGTGRHPALVYGVIADAANQIAGPGIFEGLDANMAKELGAQFEGCGAG